MLLLVTSIILVALVFDFLNGFHDSANSIATVVSTRVLSPRKAVAWAAFFNFVAAFMFTLKVAGTLGKGLVQLNDVTVYVILGGLCGAIIWDLITWYYGLPTSSSHALMGGYAGAAIAKAGFSAIIPHGWIPTLIFIVVAPVMGLVVAFLLMAIVMWLFHKRSSTKVNRGFRRLQLLSAAFLSLGHGTNDAQKTMGIITGLLVTSGYLTTFHVPIWVVLTCHFAIAMGTLLGGWRIVKTMGQKITKLRPVDGFCAETAGGITLLIGTFLGIPISTTHTINGGIMGVGATNRLSAVRWGVAGNIIIAWLLTIPMSALIGAGTYKVISLFIK
ncbi:MAG TPA: inorganic phosphate transporter [Candidatus Acidoferrales bacterium]|nr:inorganic phosphate transporter [Candidatus Acidoferrales bacterium]